MVRDVNILDRLKAEIADKTARRFHHRLPLIHIRELLSLYRINLVVDVGANVGQFGKRIRRLGYDGAIHSFEPVKQSFNELTQVARSDHKWYVHNFGLGESRSSALINVSQMSVFSSLLPLNRYASELFSGESRVNHQEQVEIDTLDNFLASEILKSGTNAFLKMDTQGYDLNVFAGARKCLPNVSCVLSEISFVPIYEGMPHFLESLQIYENNGFSVSGLYIVSRNERDLSLVEMDCMLVNRARLSALARSVPEEG